MRLARYLWLYLFLAEFHLVSASLSVNDDLLSIPFLVEIILHYRVLNIIRNLTPTILVHVEVDVDACAYVYSVSRSYIKCFQPFLMLPLSKEYRRCFMFSHILTVPQYHASFISFPLWRETTSFTFFFISFCSSRPSVFVRSRNDLQPSIYVHTRIPQGWISSLLPTSGNSAVWLVYTSLTHILIFGTINYHVCNTQKDQEWWIINNIRA